MRPLVSVVMATYQRAHLLERSLKAYELQQFDNSQMELVVIDDGSTDGTFHRIQQWSELTGVESVVLSPFPKKEGWRDCGAILNYGIRVSQGKHIILTHPEVIPGKKSLALCVEALESRRHTYACCRVYYLSPRDQGRLDTVDWLGKGNLAVREIEDFYDEDLTVAPDFTHRATDVVAQPGSRLATWESWVFGGMSRETWKEWGGMMETAKWGSVDVAFMQRRRALGITNHTCPEDDSVVIHQNHDSPNDTPTPRIEEEWKKELRGIDFMNPAKLRYPQINHLYWE